MTLKIGRNAPCYCNSGKKYKKCCGAPGAIPKPVPSQMLAASNKLQDFHEEFLRNVNLDVTRDMTCKFEEILDIDPEYGMIILEPEDIKRYANFAAKHKSDFGTEAYDLLVEREISAIIRKPVYLKRAKEYEQVLLSDFNGATAFEDKAVFYLMLQNLEMWKLKRNKKSIPLFWLCVSDANLNRVIASARIEQKVLHTYLEIITEMPKESRPAGVAQYIPNDFEEARNLLEQNDEFFSDVSTEIRKIEQSLTDDISSDDLKIDLPDVWVLVGLATMELCTMNSEKPRERDSLMAIGLSILFFSFSPQLFKDCQNAFARKAGELENNHKHAVALRLFSRGPLSLSSNMPICPLATTCLRQRIINQLTIPEKSRELYKQMIFKETPQNIIKNIEDAIAEKHDPSLAAALAICGSILYRDSPARRLEFARYVRQIGAEQGTNY